MCYLEEVCIQECNIKWLVTLSIIFMSDIIKNLVPNTLTHMEVSFLKLVYSEQNILETGKGTLVVTPRTLITSSRYSQWDKGEWAVAAWWLSSTCSRKNPGGYFLLVVHLTNVKVRKLLINSPDSRISSNVKPAFENQWDLTEFKNVYLEVGDLLWWGG